MDKMISAFINGRWRPLNYSIEVMFDMTDKYGTISNALDIILAGGKEGFEAVRWFAVKMANDAELCRRDEGCDPKPMLSVDDISMRMRPAEYDKLVDAVVEAIGLGYKQETASDDKEIDLGLAELNAKKTKAGE